MHFTPSSPPLPPVSLSPEVRSPTGAGASGDLPPLASPGPSHGPGMLLAVSSPVSSSSSNDTAMAMPQENFPLAPPEPPVDMYEDEALTPLEKIYIFSRSEETFHRSVPLRLQNLKGGRTDEC
jgi:hypothetical protein